MRRLLPMMLLPTLLAALWRLPQPPAAAQGEHKLYLPLLASMSRTLVASYLGGTGDDSVSATDFDQTGRLLIAGRWAAGPIGGVVALGATLAPRTATPARGLVTTSDAPQPANASHGAEEGYYLLLQAP